MQEDQLDEELMTRWLVGDLTAAELQEVEQHPEFPQWQRIAQLSSELAPPTFDAAASWEQFTQMRETDTPIGKPEAPPKGKVIDFRKFPGRVMIEYLSLGS